jgi:hypothetical protein
MRRKSSATLKETVALTSRDEVAAVSEQVFVRVPGLFTLAQGLACRASLAKGRRYNTKYQY